MKERVDSKGKVYTVRMTKVPLLVWVHTVDQLLEGTVYLHEGNRLKDELNEDEERFIAVTGVRVLTPDGSRELYSSDFVALNRDHILWVMPREEQEGGG